MDPEASGEPNESDDVDRPSPGWKPGTVVSVSRLAARGKSMARAIGIGELLDPLEVGRALKIRLDEGRALAPTPVTRIEAPSPDIVRVDTRNNRYEFRRIDAFVSGFGSLALESAESDDVHHHTQLISLEDWPEAEPGRFESGARLSLIQTRDGQARELGSAILLVDLVPGETASFSVGESIVGTSVVREIIQLSKSSIRLVTANSIYELRLDDPEEPNR